MKIGILFTSRNNYPMLKAWMEKVDTEKYYILNIDEDSTEKSKQEGKSICSKYGIEYMDREERGMQHNMSTASKRFKSKGLSWILWFQHDCFPVTDKFFSKFDEMLYTGKFDEFGSIGFNVYQRESPGAPPYRICDTARTPLEIGDFWYRSKKQWPGTKVDYSKPGFDQIFAVESIAWYAAALNIEVFEKYIIPTGDYHFFHAWDDMCFQFLYNNIYNVCIPQLILKHRQHLKKEYNIPTASPKADEEIRNFYWGKWGHHEVWKDRWGFEYGNRKTFEQVKDQYKGTLLYEFYNHDPATGPLKYWKIL